MEKELLFITVIGEDKKGIVARVSSFLYECSINIEDINQRVIEGYFVMTMLVDMSDASENLESVARSLQRIGDEMSLRIQIQHENVFKMMHRV